MKNIPNSILFTVYRVAINVIALAVAAGLFKHVEVTSFPILILAALILTVLNLFIKPLLVLISLPVVVMTMGVGYLLLNAIIIMIMSWAVEGYYVDGLWTAIGVSLVVSFVNVMFDFFAQSRVDRF